MSVSTIDAPTADPSSHLWFAAAGEKRRIAYSTLEMRSKDDGHTLYGYAAVFDVASEPIGWGEYIEYVRAGAFLKTIKDGSDVRLLINHEGIPLARTKSDTLKLAEDDYGLKVEAELDQKNPDAARVISAIGRGDISQMSFAFQVIKDRWSPDFTARELLEVRLFDVSIVTYPAYEETLIQLRTAARSATVVPVTTHTSVRLAQIAIARRQSK